MINLFFFFPRDNSIEAFLLDSRMEALRCIALPGSGVLIIFVGIFREVSWCFPLHTFLLCRQIKCMHYW